VTGKAKIVAWIVIVNVVAWGALYFLYDLTYHVKPPNPPSQEELHAIETRFPQVRATLERIVAFEARSEWRTLRAIRDSLARSGDFDGLALLQTQFDEHDRQIEKVLREVVSVQSRVLGAEHPEILRLPFKRFGVATLIEKSEPVVGRRASRLLSGPLLGFGRAFARATTDQKQAEQNG